MVDIFVLENESCEIIDDGFGYKQLVGDCYDNLEPKNNLGKIDYKSFFFPDYLTKISNLTPKSSKILSEKLLSFYSEKELLNIDKKLFEQKFLVLNNDNFEDIDFSFLTNNFVGFDAFKFSVENPEYNDVLKYILGEYSGKKIEINGKQMDVNSKEFFDEFRKFQKSNIYNFFNSNIGLGANKNSIMEAFIIGFPFEKVKNEFSFFNIDEDKFDTLLILYKRNKEEINKDFSLFKKFVEKSDNDYNLKGEEKYFKFEEIEEEIKYNEKLKGDDKKIIDFLHKNFPGINLKEIIYFEILNKLNGNNLNEKINLLKNKISFIKKLKGLDDFSAVNFLSEIINDKNFDEKFYLDMYNFSDKKLNELVILFLTREYKKNFGNNAFNKFKEKFNILKNLKSFKENKLAGYEIREFFQNNFKTEKEFLDYIEKENSNKKNTGINKNLDISIIKENILEKRKYNYEKASGNKYEAFMDYIGNKVFNSDIKKLIVDIKQIPDIKNFINFIEKNKNITLFEGTKLKKVKLIENIQFINNLLQYKNNHPILKNENDFNKVIKQFEKDFIEYMEIPQDKPNKLVTLSMNYFGGSDHNNAGHRDLYKIKSIFGTNDYLDLNDGINENETEKSLLEKIENIIKKSPNKNITFYIVGHGGEDGSITYKNGELSKVFFNKLNTLANKYKNLNILNESCLNGYKYENLDINGNIFTDSGKENSVVLDGMNTIYDINYMDYNNDGINSAKELAFNQMLNYSSSLIGNYGFLSYVKEKYGE